MLTLSHIINPVKVDESSDLFTAQPITFETMRRAVRFRINPHRFPMKISLYSAQFPEDRDCIPPEFTPVPDLDRSVLNIGNFKSKRKLPLIKDILDRLYEISTADYMIYTNADIACQPYFYQTINTIISEGYDCFVINRRTIPDHYRNIEEIPMMYAETGERHPGSDCFIFRRDLYRKFDLGTACIGAGWIGRALITNMAILGKKFKIFKRLHLTFHIGQEEIWRNLHHQEYLLHNKNECKKILKKFDREYGPFDRDIPPGKYIKNHFQNGNWRTFDV